MYESRPLAINEFGADGDPLWRLGASKQIRYLRRYLQDLGARAVLEEPYYFDRDYLAEFSSFYSTSARGYVNVCRRLHFFSGAPLTRECLASALGGDGSERAQMQASYLGFVVVRPISAAPLGRTVLRHYPDRTPEIPRITTPERDYDAHVAGLTLRVRGLAWQQQDAAVGACATVALWTMLHSSAFHEHHALPTTAAVTLAAHRAGLLAGRVFPSEGLTTGQICEAISAQGLTPLLMPEDLNVVEGERWRSGISRPRFASSCAALIRSGYPVIIVGRLQDRDTIHDHQTGEPLHAVCAVAFRSCLPPEVPPGEVESEDGGITHLYIHDDNLGPSVRYRISLDPQSDSLTVLVPEPPSGTPVSGDENPSRGHPPLVPTALIIGVPSELRASIDFLNKMAITIAQKMSLVLKEFAEDQGLDVPGLSFGVRFIKLHEYLGRELPRVISNPEILAQACIALVEQVSPMSLHLGVVRIAVQAQPIMDVLYDTTDSALNPLPFAHVVFDANAGWIASSLHKGQVGTPVHAYEAADSAP